VKINGMDFTILGVTPQGFFGTELFFAPDVFFPSMMQKQLEGGSGYLESRDAGNFFAAGRLKPGVSMARAEAGLNSVARGLAQQYPKDDDGMKILLTPPGLGRKLHPRRRDRIRRGAVRSLLPGPAGGLHQPGEHADGPRGRPAQRDCAAPGRGRGAWLAGPASC
jgi:hypothetical protein